jgi:hypothetical protein
MDHDDDARTTLVDVLPAADTRRYSVRLTYTEPGYAAQRGIPEATYEGTFVVEATSFPEAVSAGLAAFQSAAVQSGVSWERRVVRVTAEAVDHYS